MFLTHAKLTLAFRTHFASGRCTPARKVTTSAVDAEDLMDQSVTQGTVPKSATSELKNYIFNTGKCRSYMFSTTTCNPPYCPPLSGHIFVLKRRKTCGECLSNSSQCAWCESAQACFYFAAYLTKYPYGECRDWYDRYNDFYIIIIFLAHYNYLQLRIVSGLSVLQYIVQYRKIRQKTGGIFKM